MKKLISLLLVICMLCPMFVGCANQDEDYKMKKKYLRQFKIEDKVPEDVIIDYNGGTYNGARIVMLDTEWHDPEKWTETIGDTTIQYYDSNRLYAYKNGKFYTLEKAKKRLILKKSDVQEIAENFNNEVTHYRDTCDFYDFDEFWYWDNREMEGAPAGKKPRSDMIGVDIDARICKENNIVDELAMIEYLGEDIILRVHGVAIFSDMGICRFFLKIVNDDLDNIPLFVERFKNIPGVLSAGYFWDVYDPGASSSNNTYSSTEVAWELYDIGIEKVWEFTKGSMNTRVGITKSRRNRRDFQYISNTSKSIFFLSSSIG